MCTAPVIEDSGSPNWDSLVSPPPIWIPNPTPKCAYAGKREHLTSTWKGPRKEYHGVWEALAWKWLIEYEKEIRVTAAVTDTRKQSALETATSLSPEISPWRDVSLLPVLLNPCSLHWCYSRVIPGQCQSVLGCKANFTSQLSSNALRMRGMCSELLQHKQIEGYLRQEGKRCPKPPYITAVSSHIGLEMSMPRLLQDQTCIHCAGQVPSQPRQSPCSFSIRNLQLGEPLSPKLKTDGGIQMHSPHIMSCCFCVGRKKPGFAEGTNTHPASSASTCRVPRAAFPTSMVVCPE